MYASAGWVACVNAVAIGVASIIRWIASRRFGELVNDKARTVVVRSKETRQMYKKELIFSVIVGDIIKILCL